MQMAKATQNRIQRNLGYITKLLGHARAWKSAVWRQTKPVVVARQGFLRFPAGARPNDCAIRAAEQQAFQGDGQIGEGHD